MALTTGALIEKDPDASQWPKGIDWTNYLAKIAADETIAVSTWAIAGSDSSLTKDADSIVNGSLKTQIKLSGGTLGVRYTVTNHITTSSGVQDDQSFDVLIVEQ